MNGNKFLTGAERVAFDEIDRLRAEVARLGAEVARLRSRELSLDAKLADEECEVKALTARARHCEKRHRCTDCSYTLAAKKRLEDEVKQLRDEVCLLRGDPACVNCEHLRAEDLTCGLKNKADS